MASVKLLIQQQGVLRRVASVEIAKHDGSIMLLLVRAGQNSSGWAWDAGSASMKAVAYEQPKPKTKKVSIHTSGRVNFHDVANPGCIFVPCLLDLTECLPVVGYSVPGIGALDAIENASARDHVMTLPDSLTERLAFEFYVVPASAPALQGEMWRFVVEGKYGVACTIVHGAVTRQPPGSPEQGFLTYRANSILPAQAISEEMAFIRFQQLMHSNQVSQALKESEISKELHPQILEEVVGKGRGIQGPNEQGVWEIVCPVPMRIRPKLIVNFADSRYRAELVELVHDKRLEKVRVRFRVYDEVAKMWVKNQVAIISGFLDAEL